MLCSRRIGPDFKRWAMAASRAHPDLPVTTCHQYDIHVPFHYQCLNTRVRGRPDTCNLYVLCSAHMGCWSLAIMRMPGTGCGRTTGRVRLRTSELQDFVAH